MGDLMSNDVQSHDTVVERAAADRRTSGRHAAATLGAVRARLIGGSQVDLVNFSNRGVLFECDSRLLIGARASVRITSPEHNLVVTGRVVRSRVKGLVNGALRYDAALALDHEFALTPALVELMARAGTQTSEDFDVGPDREPVDEYLAESEASLAEAVREREGGGPDEAAAADDSTPPADEPVAFEADADIAFEPAIEFTIEPAVEFAVDGGEAVAFEAAPDTPEEPIAEPIDTAAAEPAAEPAASSFFDPTPRGMQDRGVAALDEEPTAAADYVAADVPASGIEPAAVVLEAAVLFEPEDAVDFEASFDAPVEEPALPPALPIVAAEPAVAATEPAIEASTPEAVVADLPPALPEPPPLEPLPDLSPAALDTEDRVLQQFAATVPSDLADLRRIAADNQW